jgi:hypothetical protein
MTESGGSFALKKTSEPLVRKSFFIKKGLSFAPGRCCRARHVNLGRILGRIW